MNSERTAEAPVNSARDEQPRIAAIDLFCGVGGLTRGLADAGIDVRLGVDIDRHCEFPYIANNSAEFLMKSVADLTGSEIADRLEGDGFTLLAGCAPCQPFSTYQQGRYGPGDDRWNLLQHFGRLVEEVAPDFVTMENVPRLEEQDVFRDFVQRLEALGFFVSHSHVKCAEYGVVNAELCCQVR